MAAVAIGTSVDAHWRVFQTEDKPLTPRGRSRLRGKRRTRGHEELTKHNGSLKRSGRRFFALAQSTMSDISLGFFDFMDSVQEGFEDSARSPEEFWADQDVAYSECSEEARMMRLAEEQRVIDERHHILLGAIEYEYCSRLHELPEIQSQCDSITRAISELEVEKSEASSLEIYDLDRQIEELSLERALLHCEAELLVTYQPAA